MALSANPLARRTLTMGRNTSKMARCDPCGAAPFTYSIDPSRTGPLLSSVLNFDRTATNRAPTVLYFWGKNRTATVEMQVRPLVTEGWRESADARVGRLTSSPAGFRHAIRSPFRPRSPVPPGPVPARPDSHPLRGERRRTEGDPGSRIRARRRRIPRAAGGTGDVLPACGGHGNQPQRAAGDPGGAAGRRLPPPQHHAAAPRRTGPHGVVRGSGLPDPRRQAGRAARPWRAAQLPAFRPPLQRGDVFPDGPVGARARRGGQAGGCRQRPSLAPDPDCGRRERGIVIWGRRSGGGPLGDA